MIMCLFLSSAFYMFLTQSFKGACRSWTPHYCLQKQKRRVFSLPGKRSFVTQWRQNISLQLVDFNIVLAKVSDQGFTWKERPFLETFTLPQNTVTEKRRHLGCAVPILPRSQVDAWLIAAYGPDFMTPRRCNLY